jgi:kynurenine formamidase
MVSDAAGSLGDIPVSPSPNLPSYDELPPGPHGGRLAWGVFGEDDDIGTINLLTPERVAAAAKLVRRGASFPLDAPTGLFAPALTATRGVPRHTVLGAPNVTSFDDVWDNVYPQAGSQWDSLAHVGYGHGQWYNGATREDIVTRGRNTIHRWAQHGIAGRAVVLDMPSTFAAQGRPYDAGTTVEFTVDDLEAARERAGVQIGTGDILLVNTGFGHWYSQQSPEVKRALPTRLRCPGLEHSEAICRYLWDHHIAAIASDTFAVEAWPGNFAPDAAPFGFIHNMLIGAFGLALGELWWLHDLAQDCLSTGVHEGMLIATPINAVGGIGSTANAVFLN